MTKVPNAGAEMLAVRACPEVNQPLNIGGRASTH